MLRRTSAACACRIRRNTPRFSSTSSVRRSTGRRRGSRGCSAAARRTFRSDVEENLGCMRVQDPAKYAEVLLNIVRPQEHWTAARITRMFGSGEQDLQLQPTPIWVHLTYQTAFVDNAGKLQTRRDVYNLDSRTLAAIRSARGVIEPAPERRREEMVASGSTQRRSAPVVRNGAISQSMVYPTPGYARPLFPPAFFR